MGYNLFLDDIRFIKQDLNYMRRPEYTNLDWITVRNFEEFKNALDERGIPELVSYDHDLADEHYTPPHYWNDYDKSKQYQEGQNYTEKTGRDCARYLISKLSPGQPHPAYLIHSMNPVGKDWILNEILDYNKSLDL